MALTFSIVVPTLNRRDMLRGALDSLRAQGTPGVEMIVADGGSTDGTLADLAAMPDIRVLNGPDRGLYDAINKGVAAATGDIVGLLNSDDRYEPGALATAAAAFAAHPSADAVCGSACLAEGDRIIAEFADEADKALRSPRTVLIGACIPNARFFRRAAMTAVGPFSLDYRFVADREWLMRWYEQGRTTVPIGAPVYRYQQHAGSLTFDRDRRSDREIRRELIRLAQRWRRDGAASPQTRRMAALLEGRCRASLALGALRDGRLRDAGRLLLIDEAHADFVPAMIARSGLDWLTTRSTGRAAS
jgi:glycosyltransferase involved in cell wall biosynthesis